MTEKVEYDGIVYTVGAGETVDDLLAKKGFLDAHKENMLIRTSQLVAPAPREQTLLNREENKSGIVMSLLQGMSNDQGYQTAWLAQQRFPELVERGIDPVDFYFLDEDEDIAYIDPYTNEPVKEFRDSLLVDSGRWAGPTAQFIFELGGGALGLTGGAFLGAATTGNPIGAIAGAMGGGSAGTAAGGGTAYAGRAGISAMFDGPPLKVSQLKDDLAWSAAFGAFPFGTKAAQLAGNAFRTTSKKFPGGDGRTALESILRDGGNTVDEKVAFAKEKFNVDLTRAEAQGIMSNSGQIQRYLQMQPGSQKLWDFYHNRQLQVEEAADVFFDEILRGKYLSELKQGRLSGRTALDPETDLAKAADEVLKKLAAKRQERAGVVYKNAFELDIPIDISDIAAKLEAELGDVNLRGEARRIKQTMLDALSDFTGFSPNRVPIKGANRAELGLKDNTEMLHNALINDFRPLIEGLTRDGQAGFKREVSQIRAQVAERLKVANPEYGRAAAIYDPSKGHLQALERGVVRSFAEAAELGGEAAARITKRLFNGTAKPKDINDLRRLIQTQDPQVWQNIKGTWLRTQFDDAITSSINPLGVQNKFLSRLGIRGKVMMGRGGAKARGTKAKVFEAMMEPDELKNFVDVVEMMQATSYIASQGGSPTQPLLALRNFLEKDAEVTGGGRVALNALRAVIEIPQRIAIRGFDDTMTATLGFQREAYEDKLIEALINPEVAADLAAKIEAVKPGVYAVSQAVSRGAFGLFDNLTDENFKPDAINPETGQLKRSVQGARMIESAKEVTDPKAPEAPKPSILDGMYVPDVGMDSSAFEPLQQGPLSAPTMGKIDPATSPTILPSDKDRELAMRLRGPLGGIASLA